MTDREDRTLAGPRFRLQLATSERTLPLRTISGSGFAAISGEPVQPGERQFFTIAVPAERVSVTLPARADSSVAVRRNGVLTFVSRWFFRELSAEESAALRLILSVGGDRARRGPAGPPGTFCVAPHA